MLNLINEAYGLQDNSLNSGIKPTGTEQAIYVCGQAVAWMDIGCPTISIHSHRVEGSSSIYWQCSDFNAVLRKYAIPGRVEGFDVLDDMILLNGENFCPLPLPKSTRLTARRKALIAMAGNHAVLRSIGKNRTEYFTPILTNADQCLLNEYLDSRGGDNVGTLYEKLYLDVWEIVERRWDAIQTLADDLSAKAKGNQEVIISPYLINQLVNEADVGRSLTAGTQGPAL